MGGVLPGAKGTTHGLAGGVCCCAELLSAAECPCKPGAVEFNGLTAVSLYRKLPCVKHLLIHNRGRPLKGIVTNLYSLSLSLLEVLPCYIVTANSAVSNKKSKEYQQIFI